MTRQTTVTATVPAKAILFGEHAVNRGATALAVSVGLYATCCVALPDQVIAPQQAYVLMSGAETHTSTRAAILEIGDIVDHYRAKQDYAAIQQLAAHDYFAPAKYVLAALGDALPPCLEVVFTSTIPQSAGLGSGGATFVALIAAMAQLLQQDVGHRQLATWALRGDIVAHGGVASGLDTQTSLYGGAIRYTAERQGEPVPYGDKLMLVVGNTGVWAGTSAVNGQVRHWLAEQPVRMHYFREIGLLSRLAEVALRDGDWDELGRLLNLNQLLLERIGVSSPELEQLIDAALTAGALGAKLSGSGGGGIMIALVTPETFAPVAQAVTAAGGTAITAPVGVSGLTLS